MEIEILLALLSANLIYLEMIHYGMTGFFIILL